MGEARISKEQKEAETKVYNAFANKMKASLSDMSKNEAGLQVLRHQLHTSGFLLPLTHGTPEGINTQLLLQNESKRMMYLSLRVHMDNETIIRVEMDEVSPPKQEETNAGA